MRTRSIKLSVLFALGLAVTIAAQKTPEELKTDRHGALDDAFRKKWAIVTFETPAACPQGLAGEAKPAVEGDFNGDDLPDAAAFVKTPTGVRFLAVIARREQNNVVDVEASLGDEALKAGLRVLPRGKAYRSEGDKFENYLTADTLVIAPCGQPVTAYMWNGNGFRKVVLDKSSL